MDFLQKDRQRQTKTDRRKPHRHRSSNSSLDICTKLDTFEVKDKNIKTGKNLGGLGDKNLIGKSKKVTITVQKNLFMTA